MPPLAELQHHFAAALRDPAVAPPVASTARRFAVHRANVASGILGVVEARFPATRRIVGDDFFLAMASTFIEASPPTSPILSLYGGALPDFIAVFAPADDVPYLADVARLEWLSHEAYHAGDATPIGAAQLAVVPNDRIADVKFRLHPSLRLFSSPLPALSIWQLNTASAPVAPTRLAGEAESAIVVRPFLDVEVQRVTAGTLAFCGALQAGAFLGDAFQVASSRDENFDVQQSLAAVIALGGIVGYDLAGDTT